MRQTSGKMSVISICFFTRDNLFCLHFYRFEFWTRIIHTCNRIGGTRAKHAYVCIWFLSKMNNNCDLFTFLFGIHLLINWLFRFFFFGQRNKCIIDWHSKPQIPLSLSFLWFFIFFFANSWFSEVGFVIIKEFCCFIARASVYCVSVLVCSLFILAWNSLDESQF